jgi:hypothetical protein
MRSSILELAARSMFELFEGASEGMLLVDRDARVVWINDPYRRFLPALGYDTRGGLRRPFRCPTWCRTPRCTRCCETGKPILIDLLTNRAGTFVGQPHSAARRRQRRGDRRAGHRAVRPDPRPTLQPLISQVLAGCSATWTTRGASWPPSG